MGNTPLSKKVFDKNIFTKTVDIEFNQLLSKPLPSSFDINLGTINDLFYLYGKFFYQINKEGDINSHAYLVKNSQDYIGSALISDEIQALTEEILALRQEILELQTGQVIDNESGKTKTTVLITP